MKTAQVIWSNEALDDLETIYDFIAVKSQPSARLITESILARIKQLEGFPESGAKQEIPKQTERDYRYLVEGNHKIIYSYSRDKQTVFIEIIFDTRQDPSRLNR